MYAVWLDSEVTAKELAWQLRAWRLRNFVLVSERNGYAFNLALALAKGKILYRVHLVYFTLTIFLLLLILANIVSASYFGQIAAHQFLERYLESLD
jgi:hypothetical protein